MYKFITVGLIALGMTGLAYGGFSYTMETYEVLSGPLNWSVDQYGFLNGPIWTSIAALLIGCVLLIREKQHGVTAVRACPQS